MVGLCSIVEDVHSHTAIHEERHDSWYPLTKCQRAWFHRTQIKHGLTLVSALAHSRVSAIVTAPDAAHITLRAAAANIPALGGSVCSCCSKAIENLPAVV